MPKINKSTIYSSVVISLFLVYLATITIIWGDASKHKSIEVTEKETIEVLDIPQPLVAEVVTQTEENPYIPKKAVPKTTPEPITNEPISNATALIPTDITAEVYPAVDSLKYDIKEAGLYYIDLPESTYSSLSLKWQAGVLYFGQTIDKLKIVDVSDEGTSDLQKFSELIYGMDGAVLVSIDEPTTLELFIYKVDPDTPKNTNSIAKATEFSNADSGAKYSGLNIISRDVWGADPLTWDITDLDIDDPARLTWNVGYFRADRFVIHHTASANTADDPTRAVRDIYRYHAYTRGWGDIGYNYLIDQWGNIYEGKIGGEEVFGIHANQEANTMSVGISLIGDFTLYPPTAAALNSLSKLLAEKSVLLDIDLKTSNGSLDNWMDKSVTVFGHNDTYFWCTAAHPKGYLCPDNDEWAPNLTSCPGYLLENSYSSIISTAKTLAQYSNTDLRNAVVKVNNLLESAPANLEKFIVIYDRPVTTPSNEIQALLPSLSGISNTSISGNKVVITVDDWYGNSVVPPVGWDGFYTDTFFPVSGGPKDRIRTLMKVFLMDPDVKDVGLLKTYSISPIE